MNVVQLCNMPTLLRVFLYINFINKYLYIYKTMSWFISIV